MANDLERKSIAQQILAEEHGLSLRRIIVPVGGQGGVTVSYVCPHCHRYPLDDPVWWVSSGHGSSSKKRSRSGAIRGVLHVAASTAGDPNRVLILQDRADRSEATVFRARTPPCGVCDTLINAFKILANQQLSGNGPVEVLWMASTNKAGFKNDGRASKAHCGRQSRGGPGW